MRSSKGFLGVLRVLCGIKCQRLGFSNELLEYRDTQVGVPSFVIADVLIPSGWKRGQRLPAVAAVGGLVMTAWDLVMDPIMVAGGHWVWDMEGVYFGIPLQNFGGWRCQCKAEK